MNSLRSRRTVAVAPTTSRGARESSTSPRLVRPAPEGQRSVGGDKPAGGGGDRGSWVVYLWRHRSDVLCVAKLSSVVADTSTAASTSGS